MNHLKSLREYIDALKTIGELQEIDKEVDWNLEIGAISRRCYEMGVLLDKNRMTGIVAPNQHIGMVRQTRTDIDKSMPFALVLGVEPLKRSLMTSLLKAFQFC